MVTIQNHRSRPLRERIATAENSMERPPKTIAAHAPKSTTRPTTVKNSTELSSVQYDIRAAVIPKPPRNNVKPGTTARNKQIFCIIVTYSF
jgi:hypothetical protein